MDLNKYEVFLKVVELGSLTRAADQLGYTQSAVSRILAGLEQDWGLTLLTRGKGGAALSAGGEALLPQIRAVCNAHRELEQQVAGLHGLTRGTIRIGTITSISVQWLPELMKSFLARYPGIRFDLFSSMEYKQIEEQISRGEVDCGFIALPAHLPLDALFLRRDRLLAVLPAEHPLAGAGSYPLRRFTEESYIALEDERDREIARIFDRHNLRPNVQYRVNDDYAVISMVASGLGVSILPELVLEHASRPVVPKPLDDPQFRDIALATRAGVPLSPLTAKFVEHVRDHFAAAEPEKNILSE